MSEKNIKIPEKKELNYRPHIHQTIFLQHYVCIFVHKKKKKTENKGKMKKIKQKGRKIILRAFCALCSIVCLFSRYCFHFMTIYNTFLYTRTLTDEQQQQQQERMNG